jgi:NUMOD3 motif
MAKTTKKTNGKAYRQQKSNAKRRGISWQLSFSQWWELWQRSGKWKKRGREKTQYCMARHNDSGAYIIGNVSIVPVSRNCRDRKPYKRTEAWRHRLALQMHGNKIWLGREHTDQTKKRMSRSLKGRVPGFGGKHHSESTKAWKRTHWKNQYGQKGV